MIWKNAELYNISELEDDGRGGNYMLRIPSRVANRLNERARIMNKCCCGAELRFRINSGSAEIMLRIEGAKNDCTAAVVYYGGLGAGWQDCRKNIFAESSVITIPKQEENHELAVRIHREAGIPFSSEIVRVILPNNTVSVIDIKGDIEPPRVGDAPKKRYLAYGSSVTHGSISLVPVNSWTMRVAENFEADLINLGFAGAAHLEPELAEYIAGRDDFEFATLEMGINMVDNTEVSEFENKVGYFVSTIAAAHPDKMFFCIDVPFCVYDLNEPERVGEYRAAVRRVIERLALPNTVYVNGGSLNSQSGLSCDFLHPNVRGVERIADNLIKIMSGNAAISE